MFWLQKDWNNAVYIQNNILPQMRDGQIPAYHQVFVWYMYPDHSIKESLRPSVLDSLASSLSGYILTSLAKRGGSLHNIMKHRSRRAILPRPHWRLPRLDATEYWKQDRPLLSSPPPLLVCRIVWWTYEWINIKRNFFP